jgi:hypothetical protein
MNNSAGQFIKIIFKDQKPIYGIVVDHSENWILLKSNPVDYVIDGYIIVKKQTIKNIIRSDNEKWKEKVIKLKKIKALNFKLPLDNLEAILNALTKKFGIFTLFTKEEGVCWLGKLKSIDEKLVVIDDLTPKATWEGQMTFKKNEIQMLEFDTDYINSLKLVLKKKTKSRLKQ